MKLFIKIKFVFVILTLLTSCSALDLRPWSSEDIIDGVISSAITGNKTSYGNEATCNHFKMICGSGYREWVSAGKIACSCRN